MAELGYHADGKGHFLVSLTVQTQILDQTTHVIVAQSAKVNHVPDRCLDHESTVWINCPDLLWVRTLVILNLTESNASLYCGRSLVVGSSWRKIQKVGSLEILPGQVVAKSRREELREATSEAVVEMEGGLDDEN